MLTTDYSILCDGVLFKKGASVGLSAGLTKAGIARRSSCWIEATPADLSGVGRWRARARARRARASAVAAGLSRTMGWEAAAVKAA
jgi:hypothetical protein